MCDMRGRPTICKNRETGEINPLLLFSGGSYIGNTVWDKPGIYHVGASGCGYNHYDGEYIYSLDSNYRYKLNPENKFYGFDYIKDEWKNEKYEYGVKFGEVNLWGQEAIFYNQQANLGWFGHSVVGYSNI
jgi:hypothetical protein